ncbi:uncharacterized protein LOC34621444, partial [Cyclospora cayetanensis]
DEDKEQPTGDTKAAQEQQHPQRGKGGSRLLIEVTPKIREFLENLASRKKQRCIIAQDRIDLDVLQRLVKEWNSETAKNCQNVCMADLVEGSHVVERIEAPPVHLESLSFKERTRLLADERRHQAAVRSLWGEKGGHQDSFADLNKSLAMGVNALLGLFLTFLGGYWAALYSGVETFQTRVVVGLVCSIVCLVVEVLLFAIHDERQRLKAQKKLSRGLVLKSI